MFEAIGMFFEMIRELISGTTSGCRSFRKGMETMEGRMDNLMVKERAIQKNEQNKLKEEFNLSNEDFEAIVTNKPAGKTNEE